MKKLFPAILLFAAMLGGMIWLAGCGQKPDAATTPETLYTCGMHPQVIKHEPGNCPICGMKLTPIRKSDASTNAAASSSAISIDPVTMQNMNLRTTQIARGPLRKVIRTVGTIDYNETALADVTTKFKGWIEKLNVDATGQLVHRGEPLFEVYSPELYSAQMEYLLASNPGDTNDAGGAMLRETAAKKLKFFDVSEAQIAELEKTRTPRKTLQFVAPMDGFVTEKMAVQGQMVDAGMKLYRLADLGIVWIYAQIYEQDLPYIQLGQEAVVKIASLPDREFRGRVTFIYPNLDEKTRTAKVRLEFENPGYFLKPGMFVSAQIVAELEASALLVPDSAILRSGQKNTAFVAVGNGKFEARTVMLGPESENGMYQVASGLAEGDRVVASGQFMLDSESQLDEAIEKMRSPMKTAAAPGTGTTNRAGTLVAKTDVAMVYVCPMPEHVSITYDHPGNCPICKMALVPVTSGDLKKLQPGGKVLYYTCPMPEHASVHEDKPGKCPICAMTLIPVMEVPKLAAQTKSVVESALPVLYTCGMHPEVVSETPGNCPICNMKLVPTTDVPDGHIAEEKSRKEHAH